jgi:L-lactate dehydrogenase
MNQGLAGELALQDVMGEKLSGEVADLAQGSAFLKRCAISGSTDMAVTAGSAFIVITAGARQQPGESRLSLVGRNTEIFKSIVPELVRLSPDAVICVVSNPCDIMTYVTAQLSGLPTGRVFGSGTALDSSRFRSMLADTVGVDTRSVHAYIVGEHGDSSVALWSGATVGCTVLRDVEPTIGKPGGPLEGLHKDVIGAAGAVIKAKGYTNWAIGLTVARITEAVLRNEQSVLPLSVPVQGHFGIKDKVYLSLPAVLGKGGISAVLKAMLDEEETAKLQGSAASIAAVQATLNL